MDPLTALGLASNIIQVVDFSIKLVSKGYNIYRSADGSLAENVDAEANTRNLTMLITKLRRKIGQEGNGNLSDNDQSLIRLYEKCTQIADELLHKLDQAKVTGRHRKWKSARQALKSVTGKSDLERFANTLQLYRSEITLHITISLR